MARNAIECDFRTSKMSAAGHFVKIFNKNIKFCIDLKWPEMRSKVNFGNPKWPTAAIYVKNFQKNKVAYQSKWPEIRLKVNFGHPNWPTQPF